MHMRAYHPYQMESTIMYMQVQGFIFIFGWGGGLTELNLHAQVALKYYKLLKKLIHSH